MRECDVYDLYRAEAIREADRQAVGAIERARLNPDRRDGAIAIVAVVHGCDRAESLISQSGG